MWRFGGWPEESLSSTPSGFGGGTLNGSLRFFTPKKKAASHLLPRSLEFDPIDEADHFVEFILNGPLRWVRPDALAYTAATGWVT